MNNREYRDQYFDNGGESMRRTPTLREAYDEGRTAGLQIGALGLMLIRIIYENARGQAHMIEQATNHWDPWYIDTPLCLLALVVVTIASGYRRKKLGVPSAGDLEIKR